MSSQKKAHIYFVRAFESNGYSVIPTLLQSSCKSNLNFHEVMFQATNINRSVVPIASNERATLQFGSSVPTDKGLLIYSPHHAC